MRASRIPVVRVSRAISGAMGISGAAVAAALALGAPNGPAGATIMLSPRPTTAAVLRVADPAPIAIPVSPEPPRAPKRSPTTALRSNAQPLIPPASVPGTLSAAPQPRGPLPLETGLLPLAGVAATPEPSEPPPGETKPPAP